MFISAEEVAHGSNSIEEAWARADVCLGLLSCWNRHVHIVGERNLKNLNIHLGVHLPCDVTSHPAPFILARFSHFISSIASPKLDKIIWFKMWPPLEFQAESDGKQLECSNPSIVFSMYTFCCIINRWINSLLKSQLCQNLAKSVDDSELGLTMGSIQCKWTEYLPCQNINRHCSMPSAVRSDDTNFWVYLGWTSWRDTGTVERWYTRMHRIQSSFRNTITMKGMWNGYTVSLFAVKSSVSGWVY